MLLTVLYICLCSISYLYICLCSISYPYILLIHTIVVSGVILVCRMMNLLMIIFSRNIVRIDWMS